MKQRPTSVSVVAWILIITGCLSLIGTTISISLPQTREIMLRSPLPMPAQVLIMYIGLVVTLSSGIGMLKGFNWSRILYVSWGAISLFIGLTTSTFNVATILGLLFFAVVLFFLFRPKANDFFKIQPTETAGNAAARN